MISETFPCFGKGKIFEKGAGAAVVDSGNPNIVTNYVKMKK